jgi:excisionase family DNA binding protein
MIVGERELLTITEAAEVYGCSRGSMLYMVNTGRIPHERLGNILVVDRKDLEALW